MLTIRMQRTGRKGLSNYRIVVQDSRFSPKSGRVVSLLGHYNPHTKEIVLNKEEAEKYLSNGAQPSTRVVRLLKDQKIKLPKWVDEGNKEHDKKTKNPDKLRKNQPAEETPVEEAPAEETTEEPKEENTAEEKSEEKVEESKDAEKTEEKSEEDK